MKRATASPRWEKNPTSQQLVYWAAGSGDFYQIHYDTKYAQDTGLPNIIGHGALKHAFLGELLWRFASPEGQVKRVQCSYRGMDPAVQGKDDLVDQGSSRSKAPSPGSTPRAKRTTSS